MLLHRSLLAATALALNLIASAAPVLAGAAIPPPSSPAPATTEASRGPQARPHLVVGFAQHERLQQALREELRQQGHSQVGRTGEIAAAPGLVVGGIRLQSQREGEWLSCRVNYFVADQATAEVRRVDSAAASVPLMQVKLFAAQPARAQLAQQDCYDQLARQVAEALSQPSEPPAQPSEPPAQPSEPPAQPSDPAPSA